MPSGRGGGCLLGVFQWYIQKFQDADQRQFRRHFLDNFTFSFGGNRL